MERAMTRRRTGAWLAVAFGVGPALAVAGTVGADDTRFRIDAELRRQQTSVDGRFEVSTAAAAEDAPLVQGKRYIIKPAASAKATCNPDVIFADGFE
jgi:hypothetical protein